MGKRELKSVKSGFAEGQRKGRKNNEKREREEMSLTTCYRRGRRYMHNTSFDILW